MEFTTTARGIPVRILNGFKYLVSGKIYRRCAVNQKCGGSVTTEDGVLPRENAVHTHPSSQVQAQVDRVVKNMWSCSYTERFGYVGKVTQKCRQSETYVPK